MGDGYQTRPGGFCTTDDGRIGCSPDRLLIGAAGGVEIKCTAPATHMGLFEDGPGDDHRQQVQGILLIAELDFMDFYGYHPRLPPACFRTGRDEPYIAKMRAALAEFCDMRDAMLERARASGFFATFRFKTSKRTAHLPEDANGLGQAA